MGLLDFVDTTFILTLGIILLISGGIMIYCYRRLNVLENGLIQQGKVIQDFITNYNLNMRENIMNMSNMNNVHTNNSFNDNVIPQSVEDYMHLNDKIMVSDDDDSDDSDQIAMIVTMM